MACGSFPRAEGTLFPRVGEARVPTEHAGPEPTQGSTLEYGHVNWIDQTVASVMESEMV